MREGGDLERRKIELSAEEATDRMIEIVKGKLENEEPIRYASMSLLINAEGEIVLTRRVKDPEKGKFSLPGGKIDQGPFRERNVKEGSLTLSLGMSGFEKPTEALLRELTEELFPKLKDEDLSVLEKLFSPQREAVIFDAKHGNFLAIYQVHIPEGMNIEPNPEEIGQIDKLPNIPSQEINAMTRFLLKQHGQVDIPTDDIVCGQIPAIITPQDMLHYNTKGAPLQPSVGKSENNYYVEYA